MSRLAITCTGLLMRGGRLLTRWVPADARVRRFLRSHVIPSRMEWVQIQQGVARGLWIRIDLARERSWWAGNHEPALQAELRGLVRQGLVMYDVGAHIGFYSLAAARLGAKVVAFEPDPESAERLRKHVERNNLAENIRVIEAASWSESMPLIAFQRGLPRSQGGVSCGDRRPVVATGPLIEVKAIRLDDFVADGGLPPHLVKIDVEGAESEVLEGAAETIRAFRPHLLVEVHTSAEEVAVTRFLSENRYRTRWEIPPEGFPRQCFASPSY
jgi:FkbM family methyltransferase